MLSCALALADPLSAQTDYADLASGRPTRIEDSQVTPRQAIEWEMAPLQVEQFGGGLTRYQVEPALSYGFLPRADIELSAPFIFRERGATPTRGLTGFGIGSMYTVNTETATLPSVALKGEVLFPGGGATTSGPLFAARALVTHTMRGLRLHLNIQYSSYHVATTTAPSGCATFCPVAPPSTPESPCAVVLDAPATFEPSIDAGAARQLARPYPVHLSFGNPTTTPSTPTQTGGNLTLVGFAADHTFPFQSLLVVSDAYMEAYSGGLPRPSDWAAEFGLRKQISPRLVLDAGLGRRFLGLRPEWLATVGTTYTFAIAALIPEARPGATHP